KQVALHDTSRGTEVLVLSGGAQGPLAWSPDSKRLATLGKTEGQRPIVKVWNAQTGAVLRVLDDRQAGVLALLWSPDGKRLFTGGVNNTIKVWDMESGGPELLTLTGPSSTLLWASDGKRLLSTGSGGPKVWEVGGYEAPPEAPKQAKK